MIKPGSKRQRQDPVKYLLCLLHQINAHARKSLLPQDSDSVLIAAASFLRVWQILGHGPVVGQSSGSQSLGPPTLVTYKKI